MPRRPRPIGACIPADGPLAALLARARRHAALLDRVRAALPDPLARHCTSAVLEGTVLVLDVDDPLWNAQLRFQSAALLSHLRRDHPALSSIRVRTRSAPQAAPARSRSRPRPPRRPPPAAADAVTEAAERATEPELRAALLRLAATLREAGRDQET